MKILHLAPHMGGGIGTVVLNWIRADKKNQHKVICFEEQKTPRDDQGIDIRVSFCKEYIFGSMMTADICLLHLWNHPLAKEFSGWFWPKLGYHLPARPLIAWVHQKYEMLNIERNVPDVLVGTSPVIENCDRYIWSTGGIDKFLKVKPKKHEGFNIGYIGTIDYKKMHPDFFDMAREIAKKIPEARFHMVGHPNIEKKAELHEVWYGWMDDIRPILEILDVFFYPLRPDHYGTCEQVLGEAMVAGVVPVVLNNPTERLIVEHNRSGLIARNPDMAVRAVEWLHNSDDRYLKDLSDGARERAKELYSMQKMIRQWDELFNELTRERKWK